VSYRQKVLNDAPLAYWRLEEASGSFLDESGNGHSLAVLAGVPTRGAAPASNIPGSALTLVVTDHLECVDSVLTAPTTYSLEAWVKVTGANHSILTSLIGTRLDYTFALSVASGYAKCYQRVGNSFISVTGTALINDGLWHHVVMVNDGSSLRMYVDGSQQAVTTYAYANYPGGIATGVYLEAGTTDANYGDTFAGSLDELALYDVALSASQVATHFSEAATPTADPNLAEVNLAWNVTAVLSEPVFSLGLAAIELALGLDALGPVHGSLANPYYLSGPSGMQSFDLAGAVFIPDVGDINTPGDPSVVVGDWNAPSLWASLLAERDGQMSVTISAPIDVEIEVWVGPDYTQSARNIRLVAWSEDMEVRLTAGLDLPFSAAASTASGVAASLDYNLASTLSLA